MCIIEFYLQLTSEQRLQIELSSITNCVYYESYTIINK
jgi:hypothetical protein